MRASEAGVRILLAVGLAGCGFTSTSHPRCDAGTRCAMDAGELDPSDTAVTVMPGSDGVAPGDGAPGESPLDVVSVAIDPSAASLTATDGERPPIQFQLIGTRRNGQTFTAIGVTWSIDETHAGTIDSTGTFTSNGVVGGLVNVSAEAPIGPGNLPMRATTTLLVEIDRSVYADGLTDTDAQVAFHQPLATDTTGAPQIAYPLNGALMPNNVAPPDVQWLPVGAEGDLFRIQFSKPGVVVSGFVRHTGAMFTHHWAVDPTVWRTLAETNAAAPITLRVDRWDSTAHRVVNGTAIGLKLTVQSLFGAIYYWDLSEGKFQRIESASAAHPLGNRTTPIANPPAYNAAISGQRCSPAQDTNGLHCAEDSNHCVACHSVSRDGQFLSAEMWGGGRPGTVYDLTSADLGNPAITAPTEFAPSWNLVYSFATFSPDSRQLLTNYSNRFGLVDPRAGASLAATGLPSENVAHPEWSPDGTALALIRATNGGEIDFTNGDVALMPVTGPGMFAPLQTVHTGASLAGNAEGGRADSHPTWSPDSQWLAFAHGTHSRSINTIDDHGTRRREPGALYLTPRAGGGAVRLDAANGGTGATDSYWPTFSPFVTTEPDHGGSYFWLAFYSQRTYGNGLAGAHTTDPNSPIRQLWITAVSTTPEGGVDPSSPPYWLPGQDAHTLNMAAYWTVQACRANSAACTVTSECCSGQCLTDVSGALTCQPPPVSMCRPYGATCGGAGDCCSPYTCYGNVCQTAPG